LVTLKSALTLDGQLALPQSGKRASSTWITSEESRAEVHRIRHASDALLTGIGTVLADDPRLTDRSGLPRRRPLLRVIVDSKLRLPQRSQIVRSAKSDVLVFTTLAENHARAKRLRAAGVEIVHIAGRAGRVNLAAVLRELGRREITSVILEAGSALNGAALAAAVVDTVVLFYAPQISGRTDVPFAASSAALPAMQIVSLRRFGNDFCVEGIIRDPYGKSQKTLR
jgi:diaminohydroxyphosphoribosylaminopyrimidine deaminase/5-amino-6-(5-phosphoribosylamino)uracil reductase